MSLNSKQQEALIKELVKLLQEQPEGRKKLPKGRPPEKLRQAIKQINQFKFLDDPEEPEEEPNAILANPSKQPKSDIRKMKFAKGPGAQSYEREKAASGPRSVQDDLTKPNFDKPLPHDYKSGTFDIQEYLQLKSPRERLNYARKAYSDSHEKFSKLGEGSSRIVYDMPGTGKALKIALNNKGIGQNKEEIDITRKIHLANPNNPLVTKVFGHDSENEPTWLISEKVEEADYDSFKNILGMDWNTAAIVMNNGGKFNNADQLIQGQIKTLENQLNNLKLQARNNPNDNWLLNVIPNVKKSLEGFKNLSPKAKSFIDGIIQLRKANLESGDMTRIDHWGITEDGRLVILDYGYTSDVADKYYWGHNKINTMRFTEAHLNEDDNLVHSPEKDGPLVKGIAKGLAHVAYPFVRIKHAMESIDHFEVLDVVDFVQNDFFNKMGGEGIELVPTKVRLGAITPSGRIKKVINADVKVLPYGGKYIGGTLAIDPDSLSFDDALEFQADANQISQELSDKYLSPGHIAGKKKNKKV